MKKILIICLIAMLCFFLLSGCTITNQDNGDNGNGSEDDGNIGNPPLPGDDLGDDGDSPPALPI